MSRRTIRTDPCKNPTFTGCPAGYTQTVPTSEVGFWACGSKCVDPTYNSCGHFGGFTQGSSCNCACQPTVPGPGPGPGPNNGGGGGSGGNTNGGGSESFFSKYWWLFIVIPAAAFLIGVLMYFLLKK